MKKIFPYLSQRLELRDTEMPLRGQTVYVDGLEVLRFYLWAPEYYQNDTKERLENLGRNSHGLHTFHLMGISHFLTSVKKLGGQCQFVFETEVIAEHLDSLPVSSSSWAQEVKTMIPEYPPPLSGEARQKFIGFLQAKTMLTKADLDNAKELLSLMGVPVILTPAHKERVLAQLAKANPQSHVFSSSFDKLAFGAPSLLSYSGGMGSNLQLHTLDQLLDSAKITRTQLVEIVSFLIVHRTRITTEVQSRLIRLIKENEKSTVNFGLGIRKLLNIINDTRADECAARMLSEQTQTTEIQLPNPESDEKKLDMYLRELVPGILTKEISYILKLNTAFKKLEKISQGNMSHHSFQDFKRSHNLQFSPQPKAADQAEKNQRNPAQSHQNPEALDKSKLA